MQRNSLLAGTAIALVMCAVPAMAQQKSEDKQGAAQTQSEGKEHGSPQKGTSQRKSEPKNEQGATQSNGREKGAQNKEPQGREKGAQNNEQQGREKGAQNKEQQGREKGAQHKEQGREKGAQSQERNQEKGGKGTAQAPTKEQDKKGSAQTTPREKEGKGTAQAPSKDKGTAQAPGKEQEKSGQAQSKERGTQKSSERSGSSERVQLSEQQRTNVHETLLKESNLNRASNVNVSISVGTRIPRSVRLAPLPASIISVVPTYRSYQYVVVNDQICIVDPNSFEIVEIIAAPGRTARSDGPGGRGGLMLTEEEKAIVLRSVDMDRGSTLGLGTLTEGSSVPRGASVHTFSDRVVEQVPKLKGHKFFTAENRVAIVDTQGDKVQIVLEEKR
jgi:hypothetical protein